MGAGFPKTVDQLVAAFRESGVRVEDENELKESFYCHCPLCTKKDAPYIQDELIVAATENGRYIRLYRKECAIDKDGRQCREGGIREDNAVMNVSSNLPLLKRLVLNTFASHLVTDRKSPRARVQEAVA